MRITQVKTGLKWVGLYLLANLIGGLASVVTGSAVNSSVAAAAVFACMIGVALWRRRLRHRDMSTTEAR